MTRTLASETLAPETLATTAGVATDPAHKAVAPPLHLSATYGWDDPDVHPEFAYTRSDNPTRRELADALTKLEGAASCVMTATGLAAVDLPLSLLKVGDRVLAPHDCYGGTYRLLAARADRGEFIVDFVDQTDAGALEAALAKKPKLVLIETPSNPLLRVVDVAAVANAAHTVGALVVADNTFLSPALQNPIALGCDVVVHSTTKFINGHSDVVGGAVLAADAKLGEELLWWANATGVTASPFDCFLTLRGVRTLFPRIAQQQANALALIDALQADDRVARIWHPSLPDHPGHAVAKRQQRGFGSMLSIELADGVDARAFVRALSLFTLAESLGGFESLVCIPACMSHAGMKPEARAAAGISESLVRLSVGLEAVDDLIADIESALTRATAAPIAKSA